MPEEEGSATSLLEEEGESNPALAGAFHALGSEVRIKILKELLRGDREVAELAKAVGLQPVTVRYHIGILLGDGLVEKTLTHAEGEVGRPPVRYRLRPEGIIRGFPFRQYRLLSEVLLGIIEDTLPPENREEALKAAGEEVGKDLIRGIAKDAGIRSWTPEDFVRVYLDQVMATMGSLTVVTEADPKVVQYRSISCPFQEVATRYPELICDILDSGFHQGVARGLGGGVLHERLACIGHGDPYCEYRLTWKRKEGKGSG